MQNGYKTQFGDLNVDCKLDIIEAMDFFSMLNLAQTNRFFRSLADITFRRKCRSKQFIIIHDEKSKKNSSDCDDRVEIVNDFSTTLNALKMFGHHMRRLSMVIPDTNSKKAQVITKYVNKYCSDSLTEFDLTTSDGSALHYMPKSFKNVEKVSFRLNIPSQGTETPLMNATFPAMRSLHLYFSTQFINNYYLCCYFPHLEELYEHQNYSPVIARVIRINPHIKSFTVRNLDNAYMRYVLDDLPNLQNLTLTGDFEMHRNEIVSESVTTFTLEDSLSHGLERVHFPNLQELHIHFREGIYEMWTKFFRNHKNLSRLHLQYSEMNDVHFQGISTILTDLTEVSVTHLRGDMIGINTFIRFIQSHDKLMKFDVNLCTEKDKKTIRQELGNKWSYIENGERFSIQRHT